MNNKVLTSLLSLLLITPAHASSIDLTSLSSGDSISHSCILEDKYNDSYHWQECSLCDVKFGETAHSYTSKYSKENSCADDNIKITSCPRCNYSKETPANLIHSWQLIANHVLEGSIISPTCFQHVYAWCASCNTSVMSSNDGYTDVNGNPLTFEEILQVKTVITPRGNKLTLNTHNYTYCDSDNSVTFTIDGNKLTGSVLLEVPSSWRSKYSSPSNFFVNVHDLGVKTISGTHRVYDPATGIMTYDFSTTLDDISKDRMENAELAAGSQIWGSPQLNVLSTYYALERETPTPTLSIADYEV